jgi:hypothetical protein
MSLVAGPNAGESRLVATTGSSGRESAVSFRQASFNSATAALRLNTVSGAREAEGAEGARAAQTGTMGTRLVDFDPTTVAAGSEIDITLNDATGTAIGTPTTVNFAAVPASLAEARTVIETAMRASTVPAVSQASVQIIDDALVIAAGGDIRSRNFTFAAGGGGMPRGRWA